ncbi:MAG: outer membrane lipoprotein-sorting protein [Nitrospirota bacterium]
MRQTYLKETQKMSSLRLRRIGNLSEEGLRTSRNDRKTTRITLQNLPLPLFAKEGNSPLKKGDKGGCSSLWQREARRDFINTAYVISFHQIIAVILFLLISSTSFAINADEIMKKSQAAFLYQGKDFKARVMMKLVSKGGQERIREMTMLRKNFGETGGNQKYFIYFFQPADVKDMTFMVNKYPAKDDDRWLFVPAINMVRRIAAQDKRSSFVGSDFTYEDVSGRDIEDDTHALTKEEKLGGRDCYIVKSTPKASDVDYSFRLSWIDKGNYLPLKEEYYDRKGELYKVFTADEVKDVKGFPTITKRTMKNLLSGHRTEVSYLKTDYNIGIDDSLFSERFLKQPLKKWIE